VGEHRNQVSGRPKAGWRTHFDVFPIRIRPKSGPEARFPARRLHCPTQDKHFHPDTLRVDERVSHLGLPIREPNRRHAPLQSKAFLGPGCRILAFWAGLWGAREANSEPSMVRNSASGPGVVLPARISTGFQSGELQNRPFGRPAGLF
jgi:hypothetical protein